VVVAAAVAQKPGWGGHSWAVLQYLLGFRRLGWDVTLLDWLEPSICTGAGGESVPPRDSVQLRYLEAVATSFGLGDDVAVLLKERGGGRTWIGMGEAEVRRRLAEADFLLNVMGYLTEPDLVEAAHLRVFLDIDPGFGQMWRDLELADVFRGHDRFATVGENIGRPGCDVPTCGLDWIATAPPVVLDMWPPCREGRDVFTTVGAWRGQYGPVEYRGRTYGLRVHEFRRLADLPRRTGRSFEAALDIDPSDEPDRAALESGGWSLVDPRARAGDPQAYRGYIQGSMAELMVAKNMYVQTRGGWFSDRSVCYLASGKPVVAQDTGWTANHPSGEGLLCFATLEEAAAAVEDVASAPARHARAARELAEEHFDSDRVLTRLADRLGAAA